MYKKMILKISYIFFIIIIVFTFLSKTVENMFIPVITTVTSEERKLNKSINSIGYLKISNMISIKASENWFVKRVLVKEGSAIRAGMPLLEIDTSNMLLQREKLELQVQKLENSLLKLTSEYTDNSLELSQKELKYMDGNIKQIESNIKRLNELYNAGTITQNTIDAELDKLKKAKYDYELKTELLSANELRAEKNSLELIRQKKEIEKELSINRKQLEQLANSIPENGVLVSETYGKIRNINVENEAFISKGETIIEVTPNEAVYEANCTLNSDIGSRVLLGDEVLLSIPEPINVSVESRVKSIEYDIESDNYIVKAVLDTTQSDKNLVLNNGMALGFTILQESESYKCIVPSRVIREDKFGKYVYVCHSNTNLHDTEYRVNKEYVKIQDRDNFFVAIFSVDTGVEVVDETPKKLSDDMIVRKW